MLNRVIEELPHLQQNTLTCIVEIVSSWAVKGMLEEILKKEEHFLNMPRFWGHKKQYASDRIAVSILRRKQNNQFNIQYIRQGCIFSFVWELQFYTRIHSKHSFKKQHLLICIMYIYVYLGNIKIIFTLDYNLTNNKDIFSWTIITVRTGIPNK